MNIQQLEYIIAVDNFRHFAKAAGKSAVTQPTLSMMIQKLEEELDLKIFDRSKQPVVPTKEGVEVIRRARMIIAEIDRLKTFAAELKGDMGKDLRLGIIPTLAPYLLPVFLKSFSDKYPQLQISIKEMITKDICDKLKSGELDMGIMATPLTVPELLEYPVFYEEFLVYASQKEKLAQKKYVLPKQIDPNRLWLLQEGHCFRSQVFNLCELKKKDSSTDNVHYEAGSIETLINLVDKHHGITIVPTLATLNMKASQRKNIREFAKPKPSREISIVVNRSFPRTQLLERLKSEIKNSLAPEFHTKAKHILEVGLG